MSRAAAAAGSAAFFVLAPGVVAGLVWWWLTGWRVQPLSAPLRLLGVVLLVAGVGVGVLLRAFVQFVAEGIGTPAPVAPTCQFSDMSADGTIACFPSHSTCGWCTPMAT
jgi:hypothetical protein